MSNYTIVGRKALLDILKLDSNLVEEIYLLDTLKLDKELDAAIQNIKQRKAKNDFLNQLSDGTNHQGVVSKLKALKNYTLKEIISISKKNRGLIVLLDQIQDPHNLGAVLRVAETMGVDAVIKTERNCANEKLATVAKTSCGASYLVPIATVSNLANAINSLKKEGYWIIGSSLSNNSIEISKLDTTAPVALILGGEAKGMRRQTEELCDYLVKIPMLGNLQSLNVSTAASILLYEINRLVIK